MARRRRRRPPGGQTTAAGTTNHTNFRLNPGGGYLGLYDASFPPQVVSAFAPEYPEQRADLSFGRLSGDTTYYFNELTPGQANSGAAAFSGSPGGGAGRGPGASDTDGSALRWSRRTR